MLKKGTIKFFNDEKKFGKITGPDGDVFFHESVIQDTGFSVEEAMPVEYELDSRPSDKGPRASRVRITGHGMAPPQTTGQRPQHDGGKYRAGKTAPMRASTDWHDCVFDSFYVEGYKRREIFIEAAEKMANIFSGESMTRTSIRRLFNMLKATDREISVNRNFPLAKAAERFYEFHRLVVYNNSRKGTKGKLIPDVFLQWVESHRDTVVGSTLEFTGFVEYLGSIIARLKDR